MNTFEIYVHGTPRGHQIWGSQHNHDYINTFYNHDSKATEKAILQIDICDGVSFYTYKRHQNVFDVEGRPNAFFALTIGFHNKYCSNVYLLYQLFEAVYNKLCIGSILKQSGNDESYLIADLTQVRSGDNAVVEKIQAAFTQKLTELIVPNLQKLSFGDTINKPKKTISLLEVDSPLFFDYIKKYSVIVSPNIQPFAIAYDKVANEYKQISILYKSLIASNEQLESENSTLSQENKSLSDQLHTSVSTAEKRYKSKLDQLQKDLLNTTKERDSLKQKIEEAKRSFESVSQPFQTLSHVLTGKSPEKSSPKRIEISNDKQTPIKKPHIPTWKNWFNTILLCAIFIACLAVLYIVSKDRNGQRDLLDTENKAVFEITSDKNEDEGFISDKNNLSSDFERSNEFSQRPHYDEWSNCYIDIKDGGNNLDLQKQYTLSVAKKESNNKANVPSGDWIVYINEGEMINHGNSFIIKDPSLAGKNIMIQYVVNKYPVIHRTCRINS